MLVKVRRGAFDAGAGDVEPVGEELWAGGHEGLAAASLAVANGSLEIGTWYPVDEFEALLNDVASVDDEAVPSAVTIAQPGVGRPWSAAIEVDETRAALMLCRSVVRHARQLSDQGAVWVRVE